MILTGISLVFNTVSLFVCFQVFDMGFIGAPLTAVFTSWFDLLVTLAVVFNDEAKELLPASIQSRRDHFAFVIRMFNMMCCGLGCVKPIVAYRLPTCCDRRHHRGYAAVAQHGEEEAGEPAEASIEHRLAAIETATSKLRVSRAEVMSGWCEYARLGVSGAVMVWFEWGSFEVSGLFAGMGGAVSMHADAAILL